MWIEAGARSGLFAPDEKTFAYLKGRPMAPKGEAWERRRRLVAHLATDEGATFDRDGARSTPARSRRRVTWGTSPEDVVADHRRGARSRQLRRSRQARRRRARRSIIWAYARAADAGRAGRACLHRQLHQQPDRGSARRRRRGARPQGRAESSRRWSSPARAWSSAGRGGGARPHLHRGRLRMARAGLLDVPRR